MASIAIYNSSGAQVGEVEVPLAEDRSEAAVYEAVVAGLARRRAGTASTKTRSEVHGTTRKVWRQKGSGRARQGARTAPHWKGGGSVFGPHPRSYKVRLPKKVRQLALHTAFSECVENGSVKVVEDLRFERPRTKDLVQALEALSIEGEVLIVADEIDENLEKSARNVRGVDLLEVEGLNAYLLLRYPQVLFTQKAMEKFSALLARGQGEQEQAA